jgi:hypothetical protein
MLSERFPSQQQGLANQQVKTWRQIDPRQNSLLGKKLRRATRQAMCEIEKRTEEIRLANRLNCNPTATEVQILNMWGQEINKLAEASHAIYCKDWELHGNKRTAIFVRAVSAQLSQTINRLGSTAAHAARRLHRRRGGTAGSLEGSYTGLARKLCEDLKQRLEIEAEDLEVQAAQEDTRLNTARESVLPSAASKVILADSSARQAGRLKAAVIADRTARKRARVDLGEWAEERLREGLAFVRLVRAGKQPERLRTEFPVLFTEVIDKLQKRKQDLLFAEAQQLPMKVSDLMERIADVKGLSAATLIDYRKEYRCETGTARKCRQPKAKKTRPDITRG